MARVFISYARGSAHYARQLSEALRALGIHTSSVSDSAVYGQSTSESIRRNMRSSDRLVVLLTPQAANSRLIAFEVGAAEALGKRVIPVLIGDVDPDKLGYLERDLFLDGRKLSPRQVASRIKALSTNLD